MSEIDNISHLKNLKLEDTEAGVVPIRRHIVTAMATTRSEVEQSLKTIGYKGLLVNETEFSNALADGPKSIEFTKLVAFLTEEIRVLKGLDECVNPILSPEDSATFIMEISSFLKELGCPYFWLTEGHVSDRFSSEESKLLLLEYLSVETMGARIHRERNPGKKIELKLHESPQAADLRKIFQTFGWSRPPTNITMKTLMEKLKSSVDKAVQQAGGELLGHPILNATLTAKKWEKLNDILEELHSDFRNRREMLLKRLDCTIQSFQWSNKTKGKETLFNDIYTEPRKLLKAEPEIDVSDLLCARDDLAIIEKTSSASVRKNTKSAINSVIIGQVPDRGGRTSELAPPPPEMPQWQQRNAGPSSGSGFRGGRGGFSRGGGGQQSYGGNSYNQGGSSRGNSHSQGHSFSRENSFNRNDSNARGGFGSAGSFGRNDSFDKKGSGYSNNHGGGGNSSFRDSGSSNWNTANRSNFDSAGSYVEYSQESKRYKTFEQYQPNKTSYADQYVEESNRNQQHHARGRNRGGGRSNYSRGGGNNSFR